MAGNTDKFIESPVHEEWCNVLGKYDAVLQAKAQKKTKPGASKELTKYDKWYQNELPEQIQDRKPKHLKHHELVLLVKWKLSRGKFRPRLVQFAESNKEDDVIRITETAFKLLDGGKTGQLQKAVEEVCKLKGIGPATASAILTAGNPEKAAFMADESVLGLLGPRKLQYTMQEYLDYMEEVMTCLNILKKQDSDFGWTAHKVELVVWTHKQMQELGLASYDLDIAADRVRKGKSSSKTPAMDELPVKKSKN